MSITIQKIRAKIIIGSNTKVETPYILSFNISKTRNSKTTFSASLKILSDDIGSIASNDIVIEAGVEGSTKKIFTGFITNTTPSPCWEDPNYVILNIQGSDILYKLEDERYTRRQTTRHHKWAVITGIQRKADKGRKFKLVNHPVVSLTDGSIATNDSNADAANPAKHSNVVKSNIEKSIELKIDMV